MFFGHQNEFNMNTHDFAEAGKDGIKDLAYLFSTRLFTVKKNIILQIGTEIGDINQCMVGHGQFLRENNFHSFTNTTLSFVNCGMYHIFDFADDHNSLMIHPAIVLYKSSISQDPMQIFNVSQTVDPSIGTTGLYYLQVGANYAYSGSKLMTNPVGSAIDFATDNTITPLMKNYVYPYTDPLLYNGLHAIGEGINNVGNILYSHKNQSDNAYHNFQIFR
jgi:hypothetical protein